MPRQQSRLRDIIDGVIAGSAISAAAAVMVGVYAKPEIRQFVGGLMGASAIGLLIALILGSIGGAYGRVGCASVLVGVAWLAIGFFLFARFYGGS